MAEPAERAERTLRRAVEREVKLAAAPSFRLPDLTGVVDGAVVEVRPQQRQQATYYDTPDLRLARWGCSLRYRDTDGWTVKLRSSGTGSMLVREEILFEGDAKEPPAAALDLLRAYVRTEKVVPVTRMRTLRRAVLIRAGAVVEPVADDAADGVEVGAAPEVPDGTTAEIVEAGGSEAVDLATEAVESEAGDRPTGAAESEVGDLTAEPDANGAPADEASGAVAMADAGGAAERLIAEVVDDEVTVMDGRRLAARFRELEVEAAEGTPEDVIERILSRLHTAGAGAPDPTPKYIRAVGPRATQPPEVSLGQLASGATAGAVVRQALAGSVIRLLRHDVVVRLDVDPEGVHQARVATRRLRSDLRTFRSLLDPTWTASLIEDLRWLGGKLGAARDTDVLLARLTGRVRLLGSTDSQAAGRLLDQLSRARESAHTGLLAAIREPRYVEILDRLVEAANAPALLLEADLPGATVLPRLVREPWKKLNRAVAELDEPPSDEQLHAVRIRAKRVRYAAEAVAPVLGQPAKDFAEVAATLQDVLGEHNDAVVAVRWLRGPMSSGRSVRTAFVAGELAGLEQWAAAASRDGWRLAWKRLRDRRLRTWM